MAGEGKLVHLFQINAAGNQRLTTGIIILIKSVQFLCRIE